WIVVSNEKGFTLIEMVITIAVLSLITGMALSIIISGVRFFQRETIISTNQENTRFVTRTIGKEIRRAKEVNIINDHTIQIIYEDSSEIKFVHIGDKISRIDNAGSGFTTDISSNIKKFQVTKDPVTNTIVLYIESLDKPKGTLVKITSKFNLRKKAV
ncbi:MAG TPA: prepilin-type N-terminal cleavage/methylation domain-containing protein, partial [Clostridiales bacterium]|nr:prepilin-type N-terminal cleavage/methylation domain-containing protein [Clostridiales bacterium]